MAAQVEGETGLVESFVLLMGHEIFQESPFKGTGSMEGLVAAGKGALQARTDPGIRLIRTEVAVLCV